MYTNNLEIIINAPVKKVWQALTDGEKIRLWMENVKVKTDWREGSPIFYTCYDKVGNVMTWNGKQMVWDGLIEKVVPKKIISYIYPSKAIGLEKEVYNLVEVFPEITKVTFAQEFISKENAKGCSGDAKHTLEKLKKFLELRY